MENANGKIFNNPENASFRGIKGSDKVSSSRSIIFAAKFFLLTIRPRFIRREQKSTRARVSLKRREKPDIRIAGPVWIFPRTSRVTGLYTDPPNYESHPENHKIPMAGLNQQVKLQRTMEGCVTRDEEYTWPIRYWARPAAIVFVNNIFVDDQRAKGRQRNGGLLY